MLEGSGKNLLIARSLIEHSIEDECFALLVDQALVAILKEDDVLLDLHDTLMTILKWSDPDEYLKVSVILVHVFKRKL